MSNASTGIMPDLLVTLLVAAVPLVADLLLAGGAMTMLLGGPR